jgi:hypothetical protein
MTDKSRSLDPRTLNCVVAEGSATLNETVEIATKIHLDQTLLTIWPPRCQCCTSFLTAYGWQEAEGGGGVDSYSPVDQLTTAWAIRSVQRQRRQRQIGGNPIRHQLRRTQCHSISQPMHSSKAPFLFIRTSRGNGNIPHGSFRQIPNNALGHICTVILAFILIAGHGTLLKLYTNKPMVRTYNSSPQCSLHSGGAHCALSAHTTFRSSERLEVPK